MGAVEGVDGKGIRWLVDWLVGGCCVSFESIESTGLRWVVNILLEVNGSMCFEGRCEYWDEINGEKCV